MSKFGKGAITITVSRSGTSWTFAGSDDANGNLVVVHGQHDIVFDRAAGQTWQFVQPYITFGPSSSNKSNPTIPGVLSKKGGSSPSKIEIEDVNSQNHGTAAFYWYSLHTDLGVIDPMMVNDGGP